MTRLTTLSLAVMFLAAGSAETAGLPDWLIGEWAVTKVYQEDEDVYPDTAHEPVAWLGGKTMKVDQNSLELVGEICTDLTTQQKHGTIASVVRHEFGLPPKGLGLKPRPGRLPYLDISCGRSFTFGEGREIDRESNDLHWFIFPNGTDKIEMLFFRGSYVELQRKNSDKPAF